MNIVKLLREIKTEFPKNSKDITITLKLLLNDIESLRDNIKEESMDYMINDDFENTTKCIDTLKTINEYRNQLLEIINISSNEGIRDALIEARTLELEVNKSFDLDYSFTGTKPIGFKILGKGIPVKSWRKLMLETCEALISINPIRFLSIVNSGEIRALRKNKDDCISGELLSNGFFVETNASSMDIANLVKELLIIFEIKSSEYEIYLKDS